MDFELRFTDKEITAWGGMGLMKRMLDHVQFDAALSCAGLLANTGQRLGNKRGAQPGHKGHTRAMLDESEVDRLVDCKPDAVCECGGEVALMD